MEQIISQSKIIQILSKYKYILLIMVAGIALLLLPSTNNSATQNTGISESEVNILSVEDQLSQILGSVKGAGKVQVMLSISNGEETIYQTNENHTSDADRISHDTDTVTITDSGRAQTGLVRQVNPPTYSGAIVVCQGADDPGVRLSIMEAVSKITGLRTDKISVLKMK